jgi:integrase
MTVARGFARHMAGVNPHTEIPPVGLVSFQQRWRPPFIYTAADIAALMSAARRTIPTPMRAATVETLIGLLAATGMRVGEAIRFERYDSVGTQPAISEQRGRSATMGFTKATKEGVERCQTGPARQRGFWSSTTRLRSAFTVPRPSEL